MRPFVKYQVIYTNEERYPVSVMCHFFGLSRSGYRKELLDDIMEMIRIPSVNVPEEENAPFGME